MSNFEAILKMSKAELEAFLDQVYLTGLNAGMYAAKLSDEQEEKQTILNDNPFNALWLDKSAEEATKVIFTEDGDENLLDALTQAIFRNAGMDHEI